MKYKIKYIETSTQDQLVEMPEGAQIIDTKYVRESISGVRQDIGSRDRLIQYLTLQDMYAENPKLLDDVPEYLLRSYPTPASGGKIIVYKLLIIPEGD